MKTNEYLTDDEKSFEKMLKNHLSKKWVKIQKEKVVFTKAEQNNFNNTVEIALKFQRMKKKAFQTDKNNITFGQFLYTLRTHCKIPVSSLSKILSINTEIIEKIEGGNTQPYLFPIKAVCSILIEFKIKLKEFSQMLKNKISIDLMRAETSENFARSHTDIKKSKELQYGMDAMLQAISEEENKNSIELDNLTENYIAEIKKYLSNLGRLDLLK